jgi:hypothetical protein
MNKFGKPTEEDYQTVREVIERMVMRAPEILLAQMQGEFIPSSLLDAMSCVLQNNHLIYMGYSSRKMQGNARG